MALASLRPFMGFEAQRKKVITMSDLIQDQAKLKTFIQKALSDYTSAGRRIHIAVVSAVFHAARTGDPSLLNFAYKGLRSNDQGAVKLFVRRAHAIIGLGGDNPDMKPSEVVQAAIEKGTVLGLKQGDFFIVKGHTSDEAKTLAKLCETRFINPDGEVDKFILDRNNFTETKIVGDADMLKSIVALAKRLESTSETTKVEVKNNRVRDFIAKMGDQASTMLSQLDLGQPDNVRPKAAAKAARTRVKAGNKAPVGIAAAPAIVN
jgi:hypothetical protein